MNGDGGEHTMVARVGLDDIAGNDCILTAKENDPDI
jgi:hypothetical protein